MQTIGKRIAYTTLAILFLCVLFSAVSCSKSTEAKGPTELIFWDLRTEGPAVEMIDTIIANFQAANPNIKISRSAFANEDLRATISIPQNFLGMLEDLTGRPDAGMSLKKLTEKYHLNPTYISNKFQEYFGQSPIVLHRKVMIEAAKERLLVSSENIGDIAAEFGFRDTSAFTRFFTKIAGISPSAYRNSR